MKRHNLFLASLILCVLASGCASTSNTDNINEPDRSNLKDNTITATRESASYHNKGPEPRNTSLSLDLDYYKLSGDCLSDEFLTSRDLFFSDIEDFHEKKINEFEKYITSDVYNDLDSVIALSNEFHETTEYIERNDKLVFSSIVCKNGCYGGEVYSEFYCFNYDVQNEIPLKLSDVVSNYELFASTLITALDTYPPSLKYLKDSSHYEYLFYNTYWEVPDVRQLDRVDWVLDENGLTIYISQYQVGSACHYTIPYGSECLNPFYNLLEDEIYSSEFVRKYDDTVIVQ